MYDIRGNRIVGGQHEYIEDPNGTTSYVKSVTGVYPMLKGLEYGGGTGQTPEQLASQRANTTLAGAAWSSKGGIISATYHQPFPGMSNLFEGCVKRNTTQAEFDEVITPGTSLNQLFIQDIDLVAGYLKTLRDNKVPVLWRPYHEMNGGWFWWGRKKNFKALWLLMFDRFTNYHGLNNLIWVWSPNAKNEWCDPIEDYYVGTSYVDALSLDIYNNDYKQSHYDSLMKLGKGKLVGIGENGQLPSLDAVKTTQPYAWFMTWGKELRLCNTDDVIKNLYSDSCVMNRDSWFKPPVFGLTAQYYQGINFELLMKTKIDPKVSFNWAGAKPIDELRADNFSVRWTGYIIPKYTEDYTFTTHSDDGSRVFVNGVKVVERWKNGDSWAGGVIKLNAGEKVQIVVEFYDSTGNALMDLYWKSASQKSEIMPATEFYLA
ncbi:Mannan endo-1,4-beta-mannosidase [compost metagenome]